MQTEVSDDVPHYLYIMLIYDENDNTTAFTYYYIFKDHLGNPPMAGEVARMVPQWQYFH